MDQGRSSNEPGLGSPGEAFIELYVALPALLEPVSSRAAVLKMGQPSAESGLKRAEEFVLPLSIAIHLPRVFVKHKCVLHSSD